MAAGLGFKDFVTGEVLTAADVDGYLMQGIWVFASAAARDAAVTSPQEGNACYLKDTNEVLTYSGSAWVAVGGGGSTFAGVLVNGSDQNLTNATNTILAWNAEVFDTNGYHDNATNNSRLTVPSGKAGYYVIQSNVSFNLNSTGERNYAILKNGTAVNYFNWSPGTQYNSLPSSIVINLAVGDYVQVRAYQSSGGSLTVYGTDYSFFSMNYLGA